MTKFLNVVINKFGPAFEIIGAATVVIGAIAAFVGIIFISPIIGVLIGAFTGWVVSILAPVWVPTGLSFIGIHVRPDQLVELGAALGFVGAFFRSRLNITKKDKE